MAHLAKVAPVLTSMPLLSKEVRPLLTRASWLAVICTL